MSDPDASLRGKIGAAITHALYNSQDLTAAARAAATTKLNERFLTVIDPDHTLSAEERTARLRQARRAYFLSLALVSARVRRARSERKALLASRERLGHGNQRG